MEQQKKIYFVSDAHLGSLLLNDKIAHERKLVRWLERVRPTAQVIYLLGDIFDFWFEYKTVVPKGYVRLLGKLAEMVDEGIEIHFFTGNHDIWAFDYFEQELGLIVHRKPETIDILGKSFYLAHGDGLDNDKGFKFIRKLFHSHFAQVLFSYYPIRWGQRFGYRWSMQNRLKHQNYDGKYMGEHQENLVKYSKNYLETHPDIDFFIYGHRHVALDLQIKNNSRIIILGDFVSIFSYGVYDGENFRLEFVE
ncbi:MAG: UDP-2,3-diacylglucosamine hydrolase [Porphyromonadaceae bacterium CG2_30_38_12]|nr:MAG: UDP-2,3-diacylglucosamine hydrolase [Porphyromonadaceae bacterium CG2_30_38_12]